MNATPIPVGAEPLPLDDDPPQRTGKAGTKRKRSGNRFAVLNAFLDASLRELTRAELATWLMLYRDCKPDGLARTGQVDVARRVGCDPATVKRAVRSLHRKGLLIVVRRGGLRSGPSVYRVVPLAGMGASATPV